MKKFAEWLDKTRHNITWFVIGWCCFGSLQYLSTKQYAYSAFMILAAIANYLVWHTSSKK